MKTFLENVAEQLVNKYSDRLSEICVVLTNRRASLFLKKHLAELLGKTSWSPQIFSIEDFIDELSEFENINTLTTLFELYEIHKTIEGKDAQTFDDFYKWGNILVQDFNEVDLYMVNAENLYNYLSEIKSLSEWKLEITDEEGIQSNYLKFFKSLNTYYQLLNKRLNEKKWAYNGKMFRSVAEQIEIKAKNLNWDHIIFAGFNALSLAEEKILFTLYESSKAEFYWDTDDYYLTHTSSGVPHEAGLFLRKYLDKFDKKEISWIENHLKTDSKNIQIFGIPKQVGQAKFSAQILNTNSIFQTSNHKSAIILADESLLMPVLNSIPKNYPELNVTMGLPLSSSPLFGFINNLFAIQLYAENIKNTFQYQITRFRINDILKIIKHPVINNLSNHLFEQSLGLIIDTLNNHKRIGNNDVTAEELSNILEAAEPEFSFILNLFSAWENDPGYAIKNLQQIIEKLKNATIARQAEDETDLKMEMELLYQFSILINKINWFITQYQSIKQVKTLYSIFQQICKTQKLPLYGEPLKGLQLMGMLESRNLDFENLIILSVNENILPSTGKQVSFIPFELKREFNIPTYREKNAIFAYHFFRLIHRAKNINLIYNSQADQLAGGDKSRFIHQITEELARYNPNIRISEHTVSSEIGLKANTLISIPKNQEISDRLEKMAERGISASSLNSFIRCKLQFYFKEIAQLGEPEKDMETIDSALLGTVIHDALKKFYEPLINIELSSEDLKKGLKNAEYYITEAFKNNYTENNIRFGKNLLIVNVAQEFFKNFIAYEIDQLSKKKPENKSKKIISLENKYSSSITIDVNGNSKTINLKGFIDRIQFTDDTIEIIDYKTGSVNPYDLNLKFWEELIVDKKYDKVLQLLLYAWLFKKNSPGNTNISPGIYPLKQISKELLKVNTPESDSKCLSNADLDEFEYQLSQLLVQIFDPKIAFDQTTVLDTCKYCNYQILCNK